MYIMICRPSFFQIIIIPNTSLHLVLVSHLISLTQGLIWAKPMPEQSCPCILCAGFIDSDCSDICLDYGIMIMVDIF